MILKDPRPLIATHGHTIEELTHALDTLVTASTADEQASLIIEPENDASPMPLPPAGSEIELRPLNC